MAVALADCAMMLILMLARRYREALQNLRNGVLYRQLGAELEGLKLGIIGFGASGIELARRARSFGMRNLAIDIRDVGEDEVTEFGLEFVGKPSDLDDVIAQSDVVSLHLHLNEETRHIIDRRRLELMKSTALLINVSRGELVDEEALEPALMSSPNRKSEPPAGAGGRKALSVPFGPAPTGVQRYKGHSRLRWRRTGFRPTCRSWGP